MDFTREPIIESIITPKTGCKLVVRSSKSAGQEEFFVDAVEMVSFGHSIFLRSVERPKAFLVPASDYEVIEVREARLVLKNVGIDRTIKIGGGREQKAQREIPLESAPLAEGEQPPKSTAEGQEPRPGRLEKRKEKRRSHRRRRGGREEGAETGEESAEEQPPAGEPAELAPIGETQEKNGREAGPVPSLPSLLAPPSTLISETLSRYRENALFKDAFFVRDESEEASEEQPGEHSEKPHSASEELLEALEMQKITLEPMAYGSFDTADDDQLLFKDEEPSKPSEE